MGLVGKNYIFEKIYWDFRLALILELKVYEVCLQEFKNIIYNRIYGSGGREAVCCGVTVFVLLLGDWLRGVLFIIHGTKFKRQGYKLLRLFH